MLLKDGEWSDLGEIAEDCSLDEHKVEMIVSFLSKYGFMKFDKKGQKTRLRPLMREFVNEIQRIKEEEALRS